MTEIAAAVAAATDAEIAGAVAAARFHSALADSDSAQTVVLSNAA